MSFSAGSMIARASSGSRSSINSIEPLMSANSAVTVLRSPSIASEVWRSGAMRTPPSASAADGLPPSATTSVPSALPQSPQNFFSGGFSAPHRAHRFASAAPQSPQNSLPAGLSAPHFAQCIRPVPQLAPSLGEQRFGVDEVGGVEAFGEPAVDVGEHCARLFTTALRREQPREAHRRAEFQRFGALLARNLDCMLEAAAGIGSIGFVLPQQQLPLEPIEFRFEPVFRVFLYDRHSLRHGGQSFLDPPRSFACVGQKR